MKSETRLKRLAELLGESEDDEIFDLLPRDIVAEEQDEEDEKMREAEAVVLFLNPTTTEYFQKLDCQKCGREFLATYGKVQHCSIRCIKAVIEDLGFTWRPEVRFLDRWRVRYATQNIQEPRRRDKKGFVETEQEYQNRLIRTMNAHPLPLIIQPETLEVLKNLVLQEDLHPKPIEEALVESNSQP